MSRHSLPPLDAWGFTLKCRLPAAHLNTERLGVRWISKCASEPKEAAASKQCASTSAWPRARLCILKVTISRRWLDFAVKRRKKQQIRGALCFMEDGCHGELANPAVIGIEEFCQSQGSKVVCYLPLRTWERSVLDILLLTLSSSTFVCFEGHGENH